MNKYKSDVTRKVNAVSLLPLLLICAGCGSGAVSGTSPHPIDTAVPSITSQSTIQTSTSTLGAIPLPTLPFGIGMQIKNNISKNQGQPSVTWSGNLQIFPSGEYILFRLPCPGNYCFEINAFSIAEKTTYPLVSFTKDKLASSLFNNYYYIYWEDVPFREIQVLDLWNGSNYTIALDRPYKDGDSIGDPEYFRLVYETLARSAFYSLEKDQIVTFTGLEAIMMEPDFFIARAVNSESCSTYYLQFRDMKLVPVTIDCDSPLLDWKVSPSGKWLWNIEITAEPDGEFVVIPATCILDNSTNVDSCLDQKRVVFQSLYSSGCTESFHWAYDEEAILYIKSDAIATCTAKGARLIDLDGNETVIKSYPVRLTDIWTLDGKWVIWENGENNDWGLYSPYNGGEIKVLGHDRVYSYSPITIP